MNTRRQFLVGFGAGLLMVAGRAVFAAGDPASPALSPSDTVRAFLSARVRHDLTSQYALLSADAQNGLPFTQFDTLFADTSASLSHASEDGVSPLLTCVSVFFMDSHGHSGYQFSVIGPDPADLKTVLVHAQPPGTALDKAFLIKIVTTPTGGGGVPRLEMLLSYQKTSPQDFEVMKNHAKDIVSLSNLRQIGLALIMYAEAHDDYLPAADGWVDALLPQWAGVKDPNFHAAELFRDPMAPEGQRWNYAFNRALSGVKLGSIKDPATTVVLFESTSGLKNTSDTGQSLPHPGRHAGGDYYVFADGRAKWFPDGAKLNYAL
ncbi:MAG: hypothetical protein ACRYFS_01075 [Janthinobacterium lividum]